MSEKKQTYYVSVQAGSIVQNEHDTSFEFEIQATEKEISKLQELFDGKEEADDYAYFRAHVPWQEYHEDKPNDAYDYYLTEVYRMIHELGTPDTKRHIESMNVLDGELLREPVEARQQPTP